MILPDGSIASFPDVDIGYKLRRESGIHLNIHDSVKLAVDSYGSRKHHGNSVYGWPFVR